MDAIKTLKLRIKDKHARVLGQMAREVNLVWNFVNETSMRATKERQAVHRQSEMQLTYRFRLRDTCASELGRQAQEEQR